MRKSDEFCLREWGDLQEGLTLDLCLEEFQADRTVWWGQFGGYLEDWENRTSGNRGWEGIKGRTRKQLKESDS